MTARRLVLVRHAKSLQDGGADMERPLNHRGERDAPLIGQRLRDQGLRPGRVVVSPARRAQQTWALAARSLVDPPDPQLDGRIYDNTVADLTGVVRGTPADVDTMVLVGHNPSIEALVLGAGGGESADALDTGGLPTSTVAVLGTDAAWAELTPADLRVQSLWSPSG